MPRILLAILLVALSLGAQRKAGQNTRDLKVVADAFPEGEMQLLTRKVDIPRSYALVVGIGEYKNLPKEQQLSYTERDADAVYTSLISLEGGNFPAENVHKLVGKRATRENLRQELEDWLPKVVREGDRVFLYFAGHGFVHEGKGYLAPHDFSLERIAESGYSMEKLADIVTNKLKAKWKVLLTDTCHSGFVTTEMRKNLNGKLQELDKNLFSLTASRDEERSFEGEQFGGGHGVFTYFVVKGMEGEADDDRDGVVTAAELRDYVRRNVRESTQGGQNPRSDPGRFDPDMMIAYVPAHATAAAPPAPKNGTLVFEVNKDDVEIFVDGKSAGTASKGNPLRIPGLLPGAHTVKGVKTGYEPAGPRDEMVYPGQESTVKLQILIPRSRPKAAVERFDKGLEYYNKGFEQNYRKAVEQFAEALKMEPTYSQAALYLGRAYHALDDPTNAKIYYEKAIAIDPTYWEARSSYGGLLLDTNSVDEAIRQFDQVLRRNPKDVQTLYLQAQAYRIKEQYKEAIQSARAAIAISPNIAEPHFWLAESLRLSDQWDESRQEYVNYLKYSNFDSGVAGKLNYYVVGSLIGGGKKRRAAQKDIWQSLRGLAFFGLCDCAFRQDKIADAMQFCLKSLQFDANYPYAHFLTGMVYATRAQETNSLEVLAVARRHLARAVELNPDLDEAARARKMIANYDGLLAGR